MSANFLSIVLILYDLSQSLFSIQVFFAIILRVSYQHFKKQIYSFIYILKTSVRSNKS
jgi:hypothetical protein